jgi:hypothetical protein
MTASENQIMVIGDIIIVANHRGVSAGRLRARHRAPILLQAVMRFQDAVGFRHARLVFGLGLDVGPRFTVHLRVIERRFSAETGRDDVLIDDAGPRVDLDAAALAMGHAVAAAPHKGLLPDR